MNRRDFLKLIAAFTTAPYLPKEFLMPTYNYSGDFYIKLLKDLYRKNGVTIPEADFATLQRLVDDERTRDEAVRSWQRVQDNKISLENLALPFVPIYSEVLIADTASITVSIPGGYKHLIVTGSARNTASGTGSLFIHARINGDGGTNCSYEILSGISTTVGATGSSGIQGIIFGLSNKSGEASGAAAHFFSFIPHYASNYKKSSVSITGTNETATGRQVELIFAESAVTDVISYLDLRVAGGNNFQAGSAFSIYGLL